MAGQGKTRQRRFLGQSGGRSFRIGAWLHEIKHDGFRVIARKHGARVRLYSRPGNDLTDRFPLIVDALARLRSRSCIIDGEAVACDESAAS
jgi:ATP-dependent DNA ligase